MSLYRSSSSALVMLICCIVPHHPSQAAQPSMAPGNAPLSGSVDVDFGAGLRPPPVTPEGPKPTGGISCTEAQGRYTNVVSRLNQLRRGLPSARPENRGAMQNDETNLNAERQRLEEYMTWTLKDCPVPRIALEPPPAVLPPSPTYQETNRTFQPEQRGPDGRVTVEAATIKTIACQNGKTIFVYEYVNRPQFRAILPPNWGAALGGRDFSSFAEAAAVGCQAVAVQETTAACKGYGQPCGSHTECCSKNCQTERNDPYAGARCR